MDGEKLIQVSFQIPPTALDSLSRLAEQLRMLTETAAVQAAPAPAAAGKERGESDSFDTERFLALRQGLDAQPQAAATAFSDMEGAGAVSAAVSQTGDAETVSAVISQTGDAETASAVISPTGDAQAVSAEVQKGLQDAESAGAPLSHSLKNAAAADTDSGLRHTPSEERDIPLPPAETPQTNSPNHIPAVRADAEEIVPNAPEAGKDVERQVPDAESARAAAEERGLALAAVQGEVSGGVEAPVGAGVVVQTQLEMPQSRWSGVTEELVLPGPAPLTAEAVSLAFERDGRRYDNGFPLY